MVFINPSEFFVKRVCRVLSLVSFKQPLAHLARLHGFERVAFLAREALLLTLLLDFLVFDLLSSLDLLVELDDSEQADEADDADDFDHLGGSTCLSNICSITSATQATFDSSHNKANIRKHGEQRHKIDPEVEAEEIALYHHHSKHKLCQIEQHRDDCQYVKDDICLFGHQQDSNIVSEECVESHERHQPDPVVVFEKLVCLDLPHRPRLHLVLLWFQCVIERHLLVKHLELLQEGTLLRNLGTTMRCSTAPRLALHAAIGLSICIDRALIEASSGLLHDHLRSTSDIDSLLIMGVVQIICKPRCRLRRAAHCSKDLDAPHGLIIEHAWSTESALFARKS